MWRQDYSKDKNGFGIVDLVLLIILLSVIFVSVNAG
jgi:hypothetical protein